MVRGRKTMNESLYSHEGDVLWKNSFLIKISYNLGYKTISNCPPSTTRIPLSLRELPVKTVSRIT